MNTSRNMFKHPVFLAFCIAFLPFALFSQPEDQVLFEVEGNPVLVSEFEYIYNKTNSGKADYSEASLQEYLDLYTDFKLKVRRARELKLDTIPALQMELDGYKRQLSNNYLMDKEVTDKLLREAYERSKYDIALSHILFRIPEGASKTEVDATRKKAGDAHERLKNGEDFAKLATELTDHIPSKEKGGYIGFFTVLDLPDFYELENAAYGTPVGEFSDVFRSRLGFQIIKVMEKRPARGTMTAAHILIRVPENASTEVDQIAKGKIDAVYTRLKSGESFEEIAKKESQDNSTSKNSGLIGSFGINKYEAPFEDAAFGLKKDGEFSKPFRSSLGWHIVKRIEKADPLPYDLAKSGLLNRIKKDSRFQIAQSALVERIKKDNSYVEHNETLNPFYASLNNEIIRPDWEPAKMDMGQPVFTINKDRHYSLLEFVSFLQRNRNQRIRLGRSMTPQEVGVELFKDFVSQTLIKYEEAQPEKKYPDFKALMREYEEGILLFEATKRMVWDKANDDTLGLKNFYEAHKTDYSWEPRAKVSTFTLSTTDAAIVAKARKFAAKKSNSFVLSKINKKGDLISVSESIIEKGDEPVLDKAEWRAGQLSDSIPNDEGVVFHKIDSIIPSVPKSLKEARGYVVADYQDYLLKEWVEKLRETYTVTLNEKVYNSLIKK